VNMSGPRGVRINKMFGYHRLWATNEGGQSIIIQVCMCYLLDFWRSDNRFSGIAEVRITDSHGRCHVQ